MLYKNRANAGVLNKPEDFEAAAIDRSTADPARLSPAVGYMDSLGEWHAETPPPTPPEADVDIADEASLSDAKAISDESVDEDEAMPEDQPADAPTDVVAEPREPSPPAAVVPDAVKSLVTDYPSSPTPEALERPASNAPSVHDDVDAMDTREEEDEKFETPEPDAPEESVKVEEIAASSPPLAEHSPRVSVPPVTRSQSAAPTPAAALSPEAPPATPSVKQRSPVPDPTPALSPTPRPYEAEDASALTPSPSPPPAPVKAATPEEPQAELEPEPDEAVPASPVEEHDAMDVEEAVQPQSPGTDNSTVTPSAIEAPPPVRRTPAYSAAAISALFAPPPPKSPGPLAADDPASPRRRLLQPPPTQADAMAVDLDFDAVQQPGPPPPPSVLVPESAFTRRLPIPPLSSLPPTFNHTVKPAKLQRGEGGQDWRRRSFVYIASVNRLFARTRPSDLNELFERDCLTCRARRAHYDAPLRFPGS